MNGKHKYTAFGARPRSAKNPQITPPDTSFNHIHACWRIQSMQFIDPYGWHDLTPEQVQYVRSKLSEFEGKNWNQIFVDEKKRNHAISVGDFDCPQAREWMRRNMPAEDFLWTLRFSGPERVWGIFRGGAFHIIFWDPTHQIKLSHKK